MTHGFAHFLDNILQTLQPFLILTALAGWAVAMIGMIRHRLARRSGAPGPSPWIVISGGVVFSSVIIAEFMATGLLKRAARNEIIARLSGTVESVSVNGSPSQRPNEIVAALRRLHGIMPHRSYPAGQYDVLVQTARDTLLLRVCRDSQDAHEYWVYYPGFHATTVNAIGKIDTTALDGK